MNHQNYRRAVAWIAGYTQVSGRSPAPLVELTAHIFDRTQEVVDADVRTYMAAPDRLLAAVEDQILPLRPLGVPDSTTTTTQEQSK